MISPSTLPPPPPPGPGDPQAPASPMNPLLVATVIAVLAAAVMTLLWLGARGNANDAAFERDTAITERDAASDANIAIDAELRTTLDELAEARSALGNPSVDASGPGEEELQRLNDTIDELEADVARLEAENATLATDLESAQTATTDAPPASGPTSTDPPDADTTTSSSTTSAPTTIPAETAPATTATPTVDAGDVGEEIAGLFRTSVLGSSQEQCVGRAVIDELGQARVAEALASDSPGDDEEFVDAIRAALPGCNIDPSAVFG